MQPHVLTSGPSDAWNICVMTRGETWFANTEGAIKCYGVVAPGSFYDTGKLINDIALAFGDRDEGLLLVPVLPGSGTDEEEPNSLAGRWAAMEASANRAGWRIAGDAERIRDTGWITFRHMGNDRRIYMGVLTLMNQDRTPLFSLTDEGETIVKAVGTYAAVTGVLWRYTAGVSGCASIRADRADRAARQLTLTELEESPDQGQPHWIWSDRPAELHGAGRMIWSRELAPAERHGKIVTYDIRAQFLAAMVSARYGWGKPAQRARTPFDPERAGFWLVAASGLLSLDGPPLVRHVDGRGLTWVTTPVLAYLLERGISPMVYDSWTSATSSQILKPWAERIRNAIYSQSRTLYGVEDALKWTYAEANGLFNTHGGSIDRGDWHWTTEDTAMVNERRKLDKVRESIGMWPCEVYHDAVSYPVADAEEFAALNNALGVKYPRPQGLPTQIGKFKYVRSVTVQAWQEAQERKAARRGQG